MSQDPDEVDFLTMILTGPGVIIISVLTICLIAVCVIGVMYGILRAVSWVFGFEFE